MEHTHTFNKKRSPAHGKHRNGFAKRQGPSGAASSTTTRGGNGGLLSSLADDPETSSTEPERSVTPVVPSTSTDPVEPSSDPVTEPVEPSTTSTTSSSSSSSSSSSIIEETVTSTSARSSIVLPSITLETTSRSTAANGAITSVVIRSVTASSSSSSASATVEASNSDSSSGPGTGAVVGIVAGALVGVVVLASLVGYFFKTKWGNKDDDDFDDAVFNKNEFKRSSAMLPDDDGMSMRSGSMSAIGGAYSSSGRSALGGPRNGPRPPSTLERHYMHTPTGPSFPPAGVNAMPSFQPGQIINYGQPDYGQASPLPYPHHQQQQQQQQYYNDLDRQPSLASQYSDGRGNYGLARHASDASNGGNVIYTGSDLARNGSMATTSAAGPAGGMHGYPPYQGQQGQRQGLGGIEEGQEEIYNRGHSRTGTPEEPNPQYYFKSHVQSPSNGTTRSASQNQFYTPNHRLSVRNDNAYDDI